LIRTVVMLMFWSVALPIAALLFQASKNAVVNQRGFPRAADTGDTDQHVERNIDIDIFQIVLAGATDFESLELQRPAMLRLFDFGFAAKIAAGQRLGVPD